MKKQKVLIIGGNGFIGSNLAHFFTESGRFCVTSFDLNPPLVANKDVEYIQGDFFCDETIIPRAKEYDWVIHALSTVNPSVSNQSYFRGYSKDFIQTIKLCDSLIATTTKLLFLSSGGTVYGNQQLQPISETATPSPINHYGGIKLCIETFLRIHNKQFDTQFKIVRIANPYGPGQDHTKGIGFIDAALRCGLEGKVLEVWGDGEIVRDYIYIDDVCSALFAVMCYTGPLDTFNVCTGLGATQNDVVDAVRAFFPELKVTYLQERSVDVAKVVLDPSRINSLATKTPRTLKQGIKEYHDYLVKCYSDQLN
jgi:UDP-glucose 4-epimerase